MLEVTWRKCCTRCPKKQPMFVSWKENCKTIVRTGSLIKFDILHDGLHEVTVIFFVEETFLI